MGPTGILVDVFLNPGPRTDPLLIQCHLGAQGIGSVQEYVIHPIVLRTMCIYFLDTGCSIPDHLASGDLWATQFELA